MEVDITSGSSDSAASVSLVSVEIWLLNLPSNFFYISSDYEFCVVRFGGCLHFEHAHIMVTGSCRLNVVG